MQISIPEHIQLTTSAFAVQMDQSYLADHFASHLPNLTGAFQRIILHSVASLCIDVFRRGLVEIGCAQGETSVILGRLAAQRGQILTCIDPFNGAQEGTAVLYQRFMDAIIPLGSVRLLRKPSQDSAAIRTVVNVAPCFVYVDGLHTEDACYTDLTTAYAALPVGGIVCVDDTNLLRRDAGLAMKRAVENKLFELVPIDSAVERSAYRHKSWHWGTRI